MLSDLPNIWAEVLRDPYVVSIVSGMALLMLPVVCKQLAVQKRRTKAARDLWIIMRDWEMEIIQTADDEDLRFARHEQRIRRMNDHLTSIRRNLSDHQWADITELIRSHEESIEEWQLVFRREFPDFPRRFFLMDDNYRNFFEQAIKIKWLKPGKSKSRKTTKIS